MNPARRYLVFGFIGVTMLGASVLAQGARGQGAGQANAVAVVKLVAEPATVTMRAGESLALKVTAFDAAGKPIPDAFVRVNMPRGAASYADGMVTAFRAGTFTATVVATNPVGTPPVTIEIPVTVSWPALAKLEVLVEPGRLYTGVTLAHHLKGSHADGSERQGIVASLADLRSHDCVGRSLWVCHRPQAGYGDDHGGRRRRESRTGAHRSGQSGGHARGRNQGFDRSYR